MVSGVLSGGESTVHGTPAIPVGQGLETTVLYQIRCCHRDQQYQQPNSCGERHVCWISLRKISGRSLETPLVSFSFESLAQTGQQPPTADEAFLKAAFFLWRMTGVKRWDMLVS